MKSDIKVIIEQTRKEFLHSSYTNDVFVDITLSMLMWKMLSDHEKGNRDSLINWRSPGDDFLFDVMKTGLDGNNLKLKFGKSTDKWEYKNLDYLNGLLKIDIAQLKNIPAKKWENICRLWIDFFNQTTSIGREDFLEALNHLETILADQMITAEAYTPRQVVGVMLQFVNNRKVESLYDPYCRGGDMLTTAALKLKDLKRIEGVTQTHLFWKLAKLRMLMLNLPADISIVNANALYFPNDKIRHDTILLNPPFGKSSDRLEMPHPYGKWSQIVDGTNRIDIAYLGHALDHLKQTGVAVVVLPNIILSGQGHIKHVRRAIVDDKLLEAVITLPPKIFFNTGVSAVLLFLNKSRKNDRIFMMDASSMVYKKGKQFYLEDDKVIELFKRRDDPKVDTKNEHIQFVTTKEIVEQNYDLQFSNYFEKKDTFLENMISSKKILDECTQLERKLAEGRIRIERLIAEHNH